MKQATIYRKKSTDEGTFGYIAIDGYWWYTLELPDRDNSTGISSIPFGEYKCVLRKSPRFGTTWHVTDVEGRTYILIHGANLAGDVDKGWQSHLNGCITLGKSRGSMRNKYGKVQKAVFSSRTAVREFMDAIDDKEFNLKIEEL